MSDDKNNLEEMFRDLMLQVKAIHKIDPYIAWDLFCAAEALFPNSEGLHDWQVYLQSLIDHYETFHQQMNQQPPPSSSRDDYIRFSLELHHLEHEDVYLLEEQDSYDSVDLVRDPEVAISRELDKFDLNTASHEKQVKKAKKLSKDEQKEIKTLVKNAERHASSGNIPEARKSFDRAIQLLREKKGPTHILIAVIKKRLNFMKSADLFFELGCLFREEGRLEDSTTCFDSALKIDSFHVPTLEWKVEEARKAKNHPLLLSLLKYLSDAYENTNDFQSFDNLQRVIKETNSKS